MTVLVKYCGGCNSRYDRTGFVENLQKDFPAARFCFAHDGITEADIVLVICGCPAKCAAHDTLRGNLDKLIIDSEDDTQAYSVILGQTECNRELRTVLRRKQAVCC